MYSTSVIMKVERENKFERKKKREKLLRHLVWSFSVLIFSPLDFNPRLGRHNNKVVWIHRIGYYSWLHSETLSTWETRYSNVYTFADIKLLAFLETSYRLNTTGKLIHTMNESSYPKEN